MVIAAQHEQGVLGLRSSLSIALLPKQLGPFGEWTGLECRGQKQRRPVLAVHDAIKFALVHDAPHHCELGPLAG